MAQNSSRPTKAERREAARARAKVLREEQERRERRAKIARRSLLGAGALGVGGVAAALVLTDRENSGQGGTIASGKADTEGVPKPVLSDGSWTYGKTMELAAINNGAGVLEVYFDYSCHFCASFETLHAPEIEELVKAGTVTLVLHPCKVLGQTWTDQVMNSIGVVLDTEPDKALAFHNAVMGLFTTIYETQDTSMMSVANIVSTAQEAGVASGTTDAFQAAIDANTYGPWTELGTTTFREAGFQGTPTVLYEGTQLDLSTIGTSSGLTDYIEGLG
ncbi:MAG: thioredoxin domain-containing protein [Actinomyces sp.]|uniref:DsbA family protein n=1 Tax=Actinomyces sp. TaxID=29317 RepID=UPI0026DC0D6B|nr:thioredoxin domain-containing protein [Actinomyces sp.]MDO4243985.1 thioredoxin domain-containing protein [Actinomyces sp.]